MSCMESAYQAKLDKGGVLRMSVSGEIVPSVETYHPVPRLTG